ncbi:hypothetical protein PtrM4_056330 [Pyrenophora tritici-repentis]|uniref:Endonuclease/exonuclease/phosphatase domain-containing protein n=1 Tax=Pyrenophora tritici-repentis TaxID=45151 RepID=A0A834S2J4_9PLEO|nr:hypothetical protein PtrM4_056330 [Pyrenophora tritici-repentis]
MPPDSDNIIVQIPEASGNSTNTAIYLENDIQMVPIMNKRPALFSPVYDRTGRNPFQKNDSDKPTAKDPEQAIQWARNLILQASIMTNSYEEQNKLLELLDVFRDYTEKGRVTNQISDKLSAKLAFHSATLANASEKAAKTLKKATATVAGQNNQTVAVATTTTNTNAPQSYATIAAQPSKNATWTTVAPNRDGNKPAKLLSSQMWPLLTSLVDQPQVYKRTVPPLYLGIAIPIYSRPLVSRGHIWLDSSLAGLLPSLAPKKKPTPKKLITHYQIVATLEENQTINPLQARNKINEAFQKAGIAGPVIQLAALSKRNNLILTTTSGYSGEFLLQQSNIWMDLFNIKHAQPLESWTKVIVHNVPTTFEGADTLEILQTEIPIYNKGLQIVGNSYWLTKDWKNKQNSSIVIAFKTEAEAKKLGARIIILGESLRTEKYRSIPATTQCDNCQGFGHTKLKCRNQTACQLYNIKILQANLNKSIQATESTLQLAVELRVDIIAVQEPWLTPTRNNDYADTRSTSHAAYLQILPQSEPNLRPRVLFYISRTLLAETYLLEGFTSDPDAIALVVQKGNHKFNIFNLYNERGIGDIKTIPRVLLNTNCEGRQ